MPRKTWVPPQDPHKLTKWTKDALSASDHGTAKDLLKTGTPRRELVLANPVRPDFLKKPSSKLAAAAQICGELSSESCSECQDGGFFHECVILPGQMLEKCASCYISGRKCSFAKGRLPVPRVLAVSSSVPRLGAKRSRDDDRDEESLESTVLHIHPHKTQKLIGVPIDLPIPGSSTDFLICGNLKLPNPRYCGLNDEQCAFIEQHALAFRELDARVMANIPKPIQHLEQHYQAFKAAEIAIRTTAGDRPDPGETFVRPSGSLTASVTHVLHQPSFASQNLGQDDANTADYSNGCIRQIMNNGTMGTQNLIFDYLHRREKDSEGLSKYSKEILECHESFTHELLESVESKVVLFYGKKIHHRIKENKYFEITDFPLWGRYAGQVLRLFKESSFKNCEPGNTIRFCGCFLSHPQRLFTEARGSHLAQSQDKLAEIAVNIASNSLTVVPNYYSQRLWQADNLNTRDFNIMRELQRQIGPSRALTPPGIGEIEKDSGAVIVSDVERSDEHWLFSERPHSVDKLKVLLPEAITAARNGSDEWSQLSDVPVEVLRWLAGAGQSVFTTNEIVDVSSIINTYTDHYLALFRKEPRYGLVSCKEVRNGKVSLRIALIHLMRAQRSHIQNLPKRHSAPALQYLYYLKMDGMSVQLRCDACGADKKLDQNPRFAVRRPEKYWTPIGRCKGDCKSQKTEPKDAELRKNFIRAWNSGSAARELLREPDYIKPQKPAREVLLRGTKEGEPQAIELWCERCKEETVVGAENNHIWIDTSPQWTIGTNPYYYVRNPTCKNCFKNNESKGKFVPKDCNVSHVDRKWLDRVASSVQHCPVSMMEMVVAKTPPVTPRERNE